MSSKSERSPSRRIKLVGGGYRWTRATESKTSGGLKAQRRALRNQIKQKEITPAIKTALKARLAELLAQKDRR